MWKFDGENVKYVLSKTDAKEADSKNGKEAILAYLGEGALEKLVELAVPKIEGNDIVKKAIILSALSLPDRGGDVNRIHTLLYGDEGTGKGKFLGWISHHFDVPKLSHRTTGAGLTGNVNVKGVLTTTPLLAVDEMDKMKLDDVDGMLEAMSEGHIELAQAQGYIKIPAPVRIIAACNRIQKFKNETMDRFDFQIRLSHPSEKMAKAILSKRLRGWGTQTELPTPYFWIKMFLYLNRLPPPEIVNVERIEELIGEVITHSQSMRKYESILRIALAWARIELKPCDDTHVNKAIELLAELDSSYGKPRSGLSTLEVDKV